MSKQGISLIEVVIYIGLYGILIGGLFVSVYALISTSERNETKALISLEGEFMLNILAQSLSGGVEPEHIIYEGTSLMLYDERLNGRFFDVEAFRLESTGTPPYYLLTVLLSATSSDGSRVSDTLYKTVHVSHL